LGWTKVQPPIWGRDFSLAIFWIIFDLVLTFTTSNFSKFEIKILSNLTGDTTSVVVFETKVSTPSCFERSLLFANYSAFLASTKSLAF